MKYFLLLSLVFLPFSSVNAYVEDTDCEDGLFTRGDCNGDGNVDSSDSTVILYYVFFADDSGVCELESLDVNDDGMIDASDSSYLDYWLYQGGDDPPPPFFAQELGIDTTGDNLAPETSPRPLSQAYEITEHDAGKVLKYHAWGVVNPGDVSVTSNSGSWDNTGYTPGAVHGVELEASNDLDFCLPDSKRDDFFYVRFTFPDSTSGWLPNATFSSVETECYGIPWGDIGNVCHDADDVTNQFEIRKDYQVDEQYKWIETQNQNNTRNDLLPHYTSNEWVGSYTKLGASIDRSHLDSVNYDWTTFFKDKFQIDIPWPLQQNGDESLQWYIKELTVNGIELERDLDITNEDIVDDEYLNCFVEAKIEYIWDYSK